MSNVYGQIDTPKGDGGRYLNLKVGDKARIRIATNPSTFMENFVEKETGKVKPSWRMAWIVLVKTIVDGKLVAEPKGYKVGPQIAKAVQDLATSEWGDPKGYDLEIVCTGDKGSYYTVKPLPGGKPITEEQAELVKDFATIDELYGEGATTEIKYWSEGSEPLKVPSTVSAKTIHKSADSEYDPFADE